MLGHGKMSVLPRSPLYSRVALQRTPMGGGKKYVVTIVRCIRTENFPLRDIGTWEKVRYNDGYIVNGVRCNVTRLYRPVTVIACGQWEKALTDVIPVYPPSMK